MSLSMSFLVLARPEAASILERAKSCLWGLAASAQGRSAWQLC